MGLYDVNFYQLMCRNASIHGGRPAWYEADEGSTVTFEAT